MNLPEGWRQLVRFGVVGLASNVMLYGAYLGLTFAAMPPKAAMSLVWVVSMTGTFLANRAWVFRQSRDPVRAFLRFVGAYLLGYLVNWAALHQFVHVRGLPHAFVQLACIPPLALMLFLLQRYWVFRRQASGPDKAVPRHEDPV